MAETNNSDKKIVDETCDEIAAILKSAVDNYSNNTNPNLTREIGAVETSFSSKFIQELINELDIPDSYTKLVIYDVAVDLIERLQLKNLDWDNSKLTTVPLNDFKARYDSVVFQLGELYDPVLEKRANAEVFPIIAGRVVGNNVDILRRRVKLIGDLQSRNGFVTSSVELYGEYAIYEMPQPVESGGNQYRFVKFFDNDTEKIALCFGPTPEDMVNIMDYTNSDGDLDFVKLGQKAIQGGLIIAKQSSHDGETTIYDQKCYNNPLEVRLDLRAFNGPDVTFDIAHFKLNFKNSASDPSTQQQSSVSGVIPDIFIEEITALSATVQQYTALSDGIQVQTEKVPVLLGDNNYRSIQENLGVSIVWGDFTTVFEGKLIGFVNFEEP